MADDSVSVNPFGWVQVRMLGGPRRLVGIGGVYAVSIILFSALIYRGLKTELSPSALTGYALTLIYVVPACLFFLVARTTLRKAVHRDFTTDMITSRTA